jgi:3-oxoacyl-[acyl-carrier-protein] synthase II
MQRVVVTGIGALSAIGMNRHEFLQSIQNGVSGAKTITKFDPGLFKTQFACELQNLNVDELLDKKLARRMDEFTQYAMIVAKEAVEHSGIDFSKEDSNRCGVIWGSGIGGLRSLEKEIEDFEASETGIPRYNPFMIPKMIPDIAPGYISIEYGLRGINYATVSACASSSHAIINATDYIRLGRADVIISGGSEAAITKAGIGGFAAMKAMSTRNEDPQTASRPFDLDRDGFVLGEGGAALVLESYEHARARGAHILCEITGVGMSADAYHITAPHPDGAGAMHAMDLTLKDAKTDLSKVDYINVHGTSTPLGDIAELTAIQKLFGDHAFQMNISSTKSMHGHLLGGAGALECVAGILGMLNDFVPPTINHFTDDPAIDARLNLTFNSAQHRKFSTFMSNTFGFGGHNTSMLISKI